MSRSSLNPVHDSLKILKFPGMSLIALLRNKLAVLENEPVHLDLGAVLLLV